MSLGVVELAERVVDMTDAIVSAREDGQWRIPGESERSLQPVQRLTVATGQVAKPLELGGKLQQVETPVRVLEPCQRSAQVGILPVQPLHRLRPSNGPEL